MYRKNTFLLFSCAFWVLLAVVSCTPAVQEKETPKSREEVRMEAFERFINEDGSINASLEQGEIAYQSYCRGCHGFDARKMIMGPRNEPRTLAKMAVEEPRLFFYVTNFGVQERGMLPYIDEIPLEDLVAITKYAQTLPQGPKD